MGSDESHLNVSVGSDGQCHSRTVSTNHNLSEEKGEPKRYRTEVLPLTSLTHYRRAKPTHHTLILCVLVECMYLGVYALWASFCRLFQTYSAVPFTFWAFSRPFCFVNCHLLLPSQLFPLVHELLIFSPRHPVVSVNSKSSKLPFLYTCIYIYIYGNNLRYHNYHVIVA